MVGVQVPGVGSNIGPSLAVYNNRLYMAWRGKTTELATEIIFDQGIYYTTYDGNRWFP
jgi:hypothetical protein